MRRANARAEDVLKNLPTLETDRLILRKIILGDAEAVFDYTSDPEVTRYVIWDTHRTIEDSETFLRSVAERYENARAEMGYVLSRQYWGQGLMPEAVRAMIAFGFEKMGLNRLEAHCITENTASARVMEKAGMLYEGTLRQREFIKGAYRDTKIYSILKSEFSRR